MSAQGVDLQEGGLSLRGKEEQGCDMERLSTVPGPYHTLPNYHPFRFPLPAPRSLILFPFRFFLSPGSRDPGIPEPPVGRGLRCTKCRPCPSQNSPRTGVAAAELHPASSPGSPPPPRPVPRAWVASCGSSRRPVSASSSSSSSFLHVAGCYCLPSTLARKRWWVCCDRSGDGYL